MTSQLRGQLFQLGIRIGPGCSSGRLTFWPPSIPCLFRDVSIASERQRGSTGASGDRGTDGLWSGRDGEPTLGERPTCHRARREAMNVGHQRVVA